MQKIDNALEFPQKSDKCAVIIPVYKSYYSETELICIGSALNRLCKWDIFFATHEGNISQPFCIDGKSSRYSLFSEEKFSSINAYSDWLLTSDLYFRFRLYKKILICQTDAYVTKDEIAYWVAKDYDYIGAPWHGIISINPNYKSTPSFNADNFKLFVGNGGFSMRDTVGSIGVLERNRDLVSEFRGNEDGLFSFFGIVDPTFKLAPYHDACCFALELRAKETIEKTGKLPMGFHALEKHDPVLWKHLISKP